MKFRNVSRKSYNLILATIVATLLLAVIVSMMLGRYPISVKEVFGIIAGRLFKIETFWNPTSEALLLTYRLPRIVVAILVGACLSLAGVSYQGVFHNPMAAPDILGASSGAAFGAALAIFLGFEKLIVVVFAFAFSLLTVFAVFLFGSRTRGKQAYGLILAGILVSSLMSSFTSFIKLVADPFDQLPAITYWLMGSLNGAGPEDIKFAIIPMLCGIIPIVILRWRINLLTLGDNEAKTMGVNVKRLRLIVVLCSTLITAASVSVSGLIGWVGLVIPHMARRIVGNNYKYLVPVSIGLGAIFLLVVDDVSRTLFATEIPIGILTSFIGAPFFIYLIMKDGGKS